MPNIRVHELAKELKISSKELLNFIDKLGIPNKKAASNLSDDEMGTVRNSFRNVGANTVHATQNRPSEAAKRQDTQARPVPDSTTRTTSAPSSVEQAQKIQSTTSAAHSPSTPKPEETVSHNAGGQNLAAKTQASVGQESTEQTPTTQASTNQAQTLGTQARPGAQSYQGNRPTGQGYQGNRPQGQGYQGNRPQGQAYQGNRPQSAQSSTDGTTPRTGGQGYQGSRPQGQGYQGNRPQGQNADGTPRPGGQGYQGNRPAGQGYQGNRPAGQGYQGNRPAGQGYQGNRPAGQGYQGNRPQGQNADGTPRPAGQGYQGNRPAGQGYQGNRPAGQGYQGNRSAGQGYQGNRPQGDRPAGQGYQGNRTGGPGGFVRKDGPGGTAGRGGAKPATTSTVAQKPTNKRFDKAKDIKKQNAQASGLEESKIKKAPPKPNMKKITKKERKKQLLAERELEEAKILEMEKDIKVVQIGKNITVKELAGKLGKGTAEIIKPLMKIGILANINQEIDYYTARNIAESFDIIVEPADEVDIMEEAFAQEDDKEEDKAERPPVVVVMGHVDHGKTSLLDAIRQSRVTQSEAGGITQHIGAYTVAINDKPITFLDTPGHEAFTAMRMRGALITDIAILVVAADDGVMPQTIEAINHARAANVEIIVAINKTDKPSANPDRVKQELTEHGILTEDWGGETICVPVSALQKTGIDQLLEMILLVAEVRELKANPNKKARGTIIEARLDKGRGPVATVLVQDGSLEVGDPIVAGGSYGRIRAMMDDKGNRLKKAGPSIPVEILGLNEVPFAGDMFYVASNERHARQVAESVVAQGRVDMIKSTPQKVSLDDLFNQIQAGNVKDLNIVIKADVQGSVEAVKNSLERLSNDEVRIRTIHGGVGAITESDVMLASASNAIIIGFNVRPENMAKQVADEEKVDMRLYRIIYNAIEDITHAMKGMLDPIFQEKVIGHAEIRQLFKASGVGNIAGSYITDGKLMRSGKVRVIRNGIVQYEGELAALKRFKDDVKEVNSGYECGLTFHNFNDLKEGDVVEGFIMEELAR